MSIKNLNELSSIIILPIIFLSCFVLGFISTTLLVALFVSVFTLIISISAYRYSYSIPTFIGIMSGIHLLILIVLYNYLGLSVLEMNILASWKELIIVEAFTIFFIDAIFSKRKKVFTVTLIDRLLLIYLIFNFGYIFISFAIPQMSLGFGPILNGFRIQTMMVLSYFTGRMVLEKKDNSHHSFFNTLVIFGTMISLFAVIEVVVDPIPFLNSINFEKYLVDISGTDPSEIQNGVVSTYFSSFENQVGQAFRWRRSGSLYLSPIVFAQILIIILPITFSYYLDGKLKIKHLAIQLAGLVSSISRGPIIGALVACIAVFALKRKSNMLNKKTIVLWSVIFIPIVAFASYEYLIASITLTDSSAISRVIAWINSVDYIIEHPLGGGLAASDFKFFGGDEKFGGGESELFEITSRIGWIGAILYILVNYKILLTAKNYSYHKSSIIHFLSVIIFSITLGIVFQSMVNRIWKHPFIPFIYGWILALWVTVLIQNGTLHSFKKKEITTAKIVSR